MDRETLAGNGEAVGDSLSSTPFVSAPSSPGRSTTSAANQAYFFSAPASPMHFLLSSLPANSTCSAIGSATADLEQTDFEFGLSARTMSTAEELFVNGQIRPAFLSPAREPNPIPVHRRTRSALPSRTSHLLWRDQRNERFAETKPESESKLKSEPKPELEVKTNDFESVSASTSRSSSSNSSSSNSTNRNSKRWGFIKDLLLQRSKSEGRSAVLAAAAGSRVDRQRTNCTNLSTATTTNNHHSYRGRERLTYSASFSPALHKESATGTEAVNMNRRNGEAMRRRTTFLPYKQGLLFGCLGFRSRGCGGAHGFVRGISSMPS